MLISGFTFIRNALKYDYPIREAVESMLPVVDELIINVGLSEDETEDYIRGFQSPKIKIFTSRWDDSKIDSGLVLSEQTNLALDRCQGQWCLYLQADEALHEEDLPLIRETLEREQDPSIEGFSFKYLHFYGGMNLILRRRKAYPRDIRVVKNDPKIRSYGDAQTFRHQDGSFLKTRDLDAHVYHYGHTREPSVMKKKILYFHRFWHGDDHGIRLEKAYEDLNLKEMVWFWGTHPRVYQDRVIQAQQWSLTPHDGNQDVKNLLILNFKTSRDSVVDTDHQELVKEIRAIWLHHHEMNSKRCIDEIRSSFKLLAHLFTHQMTAVVDMNSYDVSFFKLFILMLLRLNSRVITVAHCDASEFSGGFIASKWDQIKTRVLLPRVYSRIHWTYHETRKGLVVPRWAYAQQILKWLGLD